MTSSPVLASADIIQKGNEYLSRHARRWQAETDTGIEFNDNFLQLLMLELTGDWDLVDIRIPKGKWNYFGGKAVVTGDTYPDDIDTNSVGNTVMKPSDEAAHKALDEILAAENEDGIIPLYYQKDRPRVCVGVCANVCTFFYTYGRGQQVRKTFDFVLSTLKNRDFGTKRYYFTPEPLFYYCFRLVSSAEAPELTEMRDVLRECVRERIGTMIPIGEEKDNAVFLAIRLLLCQKLGIPNAEDLQALVGLQQEDGGFGVGWFYNFGKSKVKIGHRGYTATLAMTAIKRAVDRKELILQTTPRAGSNGNTVSSWGVAGYLAWIKNCLWWVKAPTSKLL